MDWKLTQEVEHLSCKGKDLNSNPSPTKKKKKKISKHQPSCYLL
jgi:hypothetical protein